MASSTSISFSVGLLVCLSGCAMGNLIPRMSPNNAEANQAYVLNSEELALPCNKLKGRIQLRILEVRDRSLKARTSIVANSMQWAANTSGMVHEKGSKTNPGTVQDMIVLTAYNKRLSELGCENYDIETELDPVKSKAWRIQ